MKDAISSLKRYREKLLRDPYRPTFHFAVPEGNGMPGDPNGAFFVDGVYHLMYLYENIENNTFCWGHISSADLLHWRHHPDAIFGDEGDQGCFSGGGFVDDDKTAYITFWKFPSVTENGDNGGIAIAYSKPPYDEWKRIKPIAINGKRDAWGTVDIEVDGNIEPVSCADPSNIWKENGIYYMQTGNKCVLDLYGRASDSELRFQGDWTDLFRSEDLKNWTFAGRFYENTHNGNDWPDRTEDDMCPSFLPLYDAKENGNFTGKYLQLFISHNKGCQYYIGEFKNEKLIPETHGRMTWNDNTYFAPEALIDDKKRHIIWTWLHDNPSDEFEKYGWSGVYSFPRSVWLSDGKLKMAPVSELDKLEIKRHTPEVSDNDNVIVKCGTEAYRLKAIFDASKQKRCGFSIKIDSENGNHTDIYYDKENGKLVFDATESGNDGAKIKEEAPFTVPDNEKLSLDIFVDKSIIEVYANEEQAICRRVYAENPKNAVGIKLIGGKASLEKLSIAELMPTNPY